MRPRAGHGEGVCDEKCRGAHNLHFTSSLRSSKTKKLLLATLVA
jgi:hypothetical protein